MENNGMLILAQADHLTGEEIGFAIDQIMAWGANNVYAFPGITKKNRSGCVLLIDADMNKEIEWSQLLAEQLSIYGYHQIETTHYHSRTQTQTHKVIVRRAGACLECEIRFKFVEGIGSTGRVEHADVIELSRQIQRELNHNASITLLRTQLQSQFFPEPKNPITIEL